MFSTSYKVVTDPNDFRPCLAMVTTHQRALRRSLRLIMPQFEVTRVLKRHWHGFQMWEMIFKFPNDQNDIDAVLKRYPPYKMQPDLNWPYR